jgi:hypothetical protein
MQNDTAYIYDALLIITLPDYINFLKFIDTCAYLDSTKKFFILKSLLSLATRVEPEHYFIKYSLTWNLWSFKSFRDTFNLFVATHADTSNKERYTGPFCSLFSNNWTSPISSTDSAFYNSHTESLAPLLKDTDIHSEILKYINKFIKLNYAYVENDYEYIDKHCSTIDFNYTIIYILLEMEKYVTGDNIDILRTTFNKAINVMFIPLVEIRHSLYAQLTPASTHTKLSLVRLLSVYDDKILNGIIQNRLPSITQDMDTTYELKNTCLFILDKFKNDYSKPQLVESVTIMKDFIIKNDINNDTASIFLDISIKKVNINITTDETKKIINGILGEFLNGNIQIVDNINAFENLLSLFEQYGELSATNHLTLFKMLKKMDMLMSKELHNISYKKSILIYYLNISKAVIIDLRTRDGWLETTKRVLDNAVNIFVLFNLLNIDTETKQYTLTILTKCIALCELTKIEAAVLQIKLKAFMTPELKNTIYNTSLYTNTCMMYDYLFTDKKLVNPVFIPMKDKEIVVDLSTLDTDRFKEFIEGKTTLSEITSYNNTPYILSKKIELIGMLNSYVVKV